jgi:tetratricopeptide (TPR) repeat protein
MRYYLLAFLFAASLASPSATAQTATTDEIQALVKEGQYPQALQKIAASLQLRGAAAQSVDRSQLYMLKAECHLQQKAGTMAAESYASAAKEAADPKAKAIAAAHEALVKQSKALAYSPKSTPKGQRPEPIDILPAENRKRAFAAMLADELAAMEPKLKAARAGKTLVPIAALFKPLATVEGVEIAATGSNEKAAALRKELTEQSRKTTAEALRVISKRLGEIDKDANTFEVFYREIPDINSRVPGMIRQKAYRKRGLSNQATKELQEVNATCDKIAPALAELATGLGTEPKTFDALTEEAARIRRESDRVLDTDYQREFSEIPKR